MNATTTAKVAVAKSGNDGESTSFNQSGLSMVWRVKEGHPMLPNGVMNAEDVARYLHLGKNTVYQLAKEGKIASYHVGRKLRFTIEDVEAYVASTRQGVIGMQQAAPVEGLLPEQSMSEAASFGKLAGEPFLIAGGDIVAGLLASTLNAQGSPAMHVVRGSYTALVNLYAGDVSAAVVSLYDQKSNAYNIPYVQGLAPGASVVVIRLVGRQQGLIVKRGNPKKLTTWGGLLREDVRLANRTKGTSARVLLDEKLRAMDARCESIEGYDSTVEVASKAIGRVAGGLSDVAVGTKQDIGHERGIEFIPLQMGWVDLVVVKHHSTRSTIRQIKQLLTTKEFVEACKTLKSDDMTRLGSVIYES